MTGIDMAGRPAHAFGTREGLHTTAWAVLGDAVRRRLIGRSVTAAATALGTLSGLVRERATFSGTVALPTGGRREAFVAALDAADDAVAGVGTAGGADARRLSLQEAIVQYLTARNLAPMAGADLGQAQATGDGKGTARRLASTEETSAERIYDAEDLQAALWGLLDPRTIAYAAGTACTDATMPGQRGNAQARVADLIRRHLAEVAVAYPLAYRRAELADGDVVADLYAQTRLEFDTVTLPDLPGGLRGPASPEQVEAPAPAGWAGAGAGTGTMVGLFVQTVGGTPTISSVLVAGRGPTLLGSGRQGHHLTAHIAVVHAVRRALAGKSLPDARTSLLSLANHVSDLQTYPRQDLGLEDPTDTFADARERLVTAIGTLSEAQPDALVTALQACAAAYLALRNAMPLAGVDRGAMANSRNEARHALLLSRAQQGTPASPAAVRTAMWGLLDSAALKFIYDGIDRYQAPGSNRSALGRVADALSVHLDTLEQAWPVPFAEVNMRSYASIQGFVGALNMVISIPDLLGLIHGVSRADVAEAEEEASKAQRKRRRDAETGDPARESNRPRRTSASIAIEKNRKLLSEDGVEMADEV
ncbi:hypothetical protein [Dactylosporangium sp. CA-139066]|uniref:hypothetical protein n=1 Tax=Dactylosporangium sp. CA-139066 TaxID=3239930 RepID=UPI003D89CCC9